MPHIIVGLTPALASAYASGAQHPDARHLRSVTEKARLDLVAQDVHSLGADETVWFWAETGDASAPDDLSAELLQVPGVTAAYVKPAEGPP